MKDDAVADLIKDPIGSVHAGHDVRHISIEPSMDLTGEDSLRIMAFVGDDHASRPERRTLVMLPPFPPR
jgi:hypothetical protein